MAFAAGVSDAAVNVGAITSGSVVVSSIVRFPAEEASSTASEAFAARLASNPRGVFAFTSALLTGYGPISST
eukprot:1043992-Prorocentrum_minimum.AAC.1